MKSTVPTGVLGSFYNLRASLLQLTGTVDEDGKNDQVRNVVTLLLSSKGRI